ncbi:hypothetical protein PRIPAC_80986 [Pristionchus pacificus]|uniref:NAD(P)H-hydrate epimerase n=1 Tax=Pristionchus pacificus TaxID=54126 RepID=A0A2A6CMI3_PRIPA|nr:hypothetical protein PRIPAC_80986 [Pristionchus pacificus]|eukprot:PDM79319.1 hypothetical protein PRIPAC_31898 [Pristionchus pacificus]
MGNNKSNNKQPVAHHPSITEVQRLIDRQNAINNEKVIEALEKLPKFNLKTQDFGSFVDEFNNAQAVLNAKLEVKSAKRVFESLIENEERCLYGQIPEELKRNDDWDGYIKALFDVFHTQAEIRIARRVLTRMEQGSEESVRSFRNRIDNAAGFAYPQSKEERITPSKDAFIFGLRRSLRMKILDRVPENLNKAMVDLAKNVTNQFGIVNELELVLARGAGLFIDATPQFARSNFTGQFICSSFYGIGDGHLYTDLSGFTRVLKIEEEGGFLASSESAKADEASIQKGDNPDRFWTAYLTKKDSNEEEIDDVDEIDDHEHEMSADTNEAKGLFTCQECSSSFINYGNIIRHVEIGRHRIRPEKIHIYDYALGLFKRNLEDVQAHNNVLSEVSQAMTEMSQEPISLPKRDGHSD